MSTKEKQIKEKQGLDIRFKVGDKTYNLRSSVYDFILEEVKTKEKDNKLVEYKTPIGSGSTLNMLLRYISCEYHLRNTELKQLVDLIKEQEAILKSLYEITTNVTVECFIKPEDRKSLVSKVKTLEDEVDKLRSKNASLRRKKEA